MSRVDRPTTILTGMITAALYVILLLGFARESYMRRDAAKIADGGFGWRVIHDDSKQVCRIERRRSTASEPVAPLMHAELRRSIGGDP
jgi:hypothetical protein